MDFYTYFGSIPIFIVTMILVLINVIMYCVYGMSNSELMINTVAFVVPTFILPIGTAIFAMWLDKRPIRPMLKGMICYPIFVGTWLVINLKCLFKQNTSWEKINHVRSIKIADVGEEQKI